jgi:hypothetical protein
MFDLFEEIFQILVIYDTSTILKLCDYFHFLCKFDIFTLTSPSDVININKLTLMLSIKGQYDI